MLEAEGEARPSLKARSGVLESDPPAPGWYKLNDDGTIELCNMWCAEGIFGADQRVVGSTVVYNATTGVRVSTVFLVLDHGFRGEQRLFETMVFSHPDTGTPYDDQTRRYATLEEAKEGHADIVFEMASRLALDSDVQCHQESTRFMDEQITTWPI